MTSDKSFDLAVVGAGPAGSTLARQVSLAGKSVVLIEKDPLPRYKTCAGGVTHRARRLLDFDISSVVERTITEGLITYKMDKGFVKPYPEPIAYMVMRDRFDDLLTRKATEAGATLFEGARVKSIEATGEGYAVHFADSVIHAKLLAGADGANGVVARQTGLHAEVRGDVALEAEIEVSPAQVEAWDKRIALDVGYIKEGYAWVFPKGKHLSIGVGAMKRHAPALRGYYECYLASLGLGDYTVRSVRGHHIPMRLRNTPVARGRVLLVGDAAGVADPFSGEGIYHAIKSAQLAAPVVITGLASPSPDLSPYQRALDGHMLQDQRTGGQLLRLYALTPRVYVWYLRNYNRAWNSACKMLRGENDWVRIRRKLGPLRAILPLFTP
jgi:geranylgeranyl reductase family protein